MLKKTLTTTLISAVIGCSISFYSNAEVVLIVHPSNDASIDAKTAQRIFLGKENKFSNGKEALPINQVPESASRASFDTDTLGRSSTQVAAYWSKLVFTGKGIPPKEVNSDAEVIAIVSGNQDAVGYVDSASVTGAVKAISLN
ncbi:MAG: phosphate ABC transporter substrate-binding protein [Paraglaciecola sp.]|nr:phosphate ABC transporter substrate-binding protein [Paraglaciecola sp.]MDP5131918.1 phosphate ABC transporter substrate-binding protein [Paraglaciecola sp.]